MPDFGKLASAVTAYDVYDSPEIRHPTSEILLKLFRRGLGAAGLVFAPRRTAPPSGRLGQPGWRPSPPASPSSRQPLQADNGFFDLNSFLAQFGQDLGYIHSGSPIFGRLVLKTEQTMLFTALLRVFIAFQEK